MSRRRKQTACLVALAVAATIAPAPVSAAPPTVAVWLDGREALRLHGAVVGALPPDWTAAPARAVERTLPTVTRARRALPERLHALGERLHAQATLYVRFEPRSHQLLLVVARAGGEPVERHIAPRALKPTLAELLRGPAAEPTPPTATAAAPVPSAPVAAAPRRTVEKTTAPKRSAPASVPASAPPPTEPSGDTTLVTRAAPPSPPGAIFALALDGGVGARRLTYNQALTPNLPTYSVGAVPLLGFRAALYPLARTGIAFLRDLGAVGAFDRSLYQQSTIAGSTGRVSATWTTFDVGLRERIRFHTARPSIAPTLGVALAYGGESYVFDDGGIPLSQTPSVDYRYVRPALDARIAIGPVSFFADFGYRFILSSGYIGSRFPHASVGGLDVGAGIAIALPRDFELCLRGRYDRFFYDLHPQPGDPYVAGGALDEYAIGELALAYGF